MASVWLKKARGRGKKVRGLRKRRESSLKFFLFVKRGVLKGSGLSLWGRLKADIVVGLKECRELLYMPWCNFVLWCKLVSRELSFFFYSWCSSFVHFAFQGGLPMM